MKKLISIILLIASFPIVAIFLLFYIIQAILKDKKDIIKK